MGKHRTEVTGGRSSGVAGVQELLNRSSIAQRSRGGLGLVGNLCWRPLGWGAETGIKGKHRTEATDVTEGGLRLVGESCAGDRWSEVRETGTRLTAVFERTQGAKPCKDGQLSIRENDPCTKANTTERRTITNSIGERGRLNTCFSHPGQWCPR
jgi:hypothetical protein